MDTSNPEDKALEEIVAGGVPSGATITQLHEVTPAIRLIAEQIFEGASPAGSVTAEAALELARRAPPELVAKAERILADAEQLTGRLAGGSSSPTMPWGTGPRPADWKEPTPGAGDDVLEALEAEPALVEAETCGVQFTDKIRAYPERCQLPKGHPPSPGHRHGNIGWWR